MNNRKLGKPSFGVNNRQISQQVVIVIALSFFILGIFIGIGRQSFGAAPGQLSRKVVVLNDGQNNSEQLSVHDEQVQQHQQLLNQEQQLNLSSQSEQDHQINSLLQEQKETEQKISLDTIAKNQLEHQEQLQQQQEQTQQLLKLVNQTIETQKKQSTDVHSDKKEINGEHYLKNSIHTIVASDNSAYQHIQMRIMYQSYKNVQKMKDGEFLTGFTRILSLLAEDPEDPLENEVPTFKIYNTTKNVQYAPAGRPSAILKFMEAAKQNPSLLQGEWIHVAEADIVWVQPIPQLIFKFDEHKTDGYAQDFQYIRPTDEKKAQAISEVIVGGVMNLEEIQPIGPFPTLTRFTDLYKVVVKWERYMEKALLDETDDSINMVGGWTKDMYLYAIAAHMVGVKYTSFPSGGGSFMTQLPGDLEWLDSPYLHYTWAVQAREYKDQNPYKWEFEKRHWVGKTEWLYNIPNATYPPPYNQSWLDTWNRPFPQSLYDGIVFQIGKINDAIAQLPKLERRQQQQQQLLQQ